MQQNFSHDATQIRKNLIISSKVKIQKRKQIDIDIQN